MVVHRNWHVDRVTAALVWISMALVLADLVVYLLIIRGQGDLPPDTKATAPFVAGYLLLMAVLLWLSLLNHPMLVLARPAMRAGAAAGLLVMGVFAAFSIGVPVFLAGILATIGAIRALPGTKLSNAMLSQFAAALIAVTVLVGGFEVTQRIIVCPPSGTMGGGGSGFLTGAYSYECVNGTLKMYSGDCNGVSQGGVDSNGNVTATSGC
jgi:hypothetical protein